MTRCAALWRAVCGDHWFLNVGQSEELFPHRAADPLTLKDVPSKVSSDWAAVGSECASWCHNGANGTGRYVMKRGDRRAANRGRRRSRNPVPQLSRAEVS